MCSVFKSLSRIGGANTPRAENEKPVCSLIAPILGDLIKRGRQIDALILIGNGEVFDLDDWVDHPAVARWVLVRLGPDTLIPKTEQRLDEITENLADNAN